MAIDSVLANLNVLWNKWSIRFAVLLSFSVQVLLMLIAPLRKRTSNMFLKLLIWLAYQFADWIAIYAFGLISHSQSSNYPPPENSDLLTFWASFLLLHLGGPDTITAYALEDNKFWKRHLNSFLNHAIALSYVIFLSSSQNKLLVPTILIFVVGVGKYGERIRAFYHGASTIKVKKEDQPEGEQDQSQGEPPPDDQPEDKPSCEQATLSRGQFFKMLTRVEGDIEKFFPNFDAETAYGFLCYKINKLYMRYFTKDQVIHTAWSYIFRAICFAFYLIAVVLFFGLKKTGFYSFDVDVTYTLLLGAIAVDAFALARLIFSDEFFYKTIKADVEGTYSLVNWLFGAKCTCFLDRKKKPPKKFVGIRDVSLVLDISDTPFVHQPWSASLSAYNVLSRCLKRRPRMIGERIFCNNFLNIIHDICRSLSCFFGAMTLHFWSAIQAIGAGVIFDKLGLTEVFDTMIYVSKNPFTKELWKLIYDEFQEKSLLLDDVVLASLVGESRGEWVLFKTFLDDQENETYKVARKCINLKFDKSILVWHIATEICYNMDKSSDKDRVFSKMLSDYTCYLLVKQLESMSMIPGVEKSTYQDILCEAATYCAKIARCLRTRDKLEVICRNILDGRHGNEFNSIRHAGELARKLLNEKEKWNIVSGVWMEMLSYAAIHCQWDTLTRMVSEGGELLNIFREGVVHLGMNPDNLANVLNNQPNFRKGMRNWTKEKEVAFLCNIKRIKKGGFIKGRRLTSKVLYQLAENCSVSIYDLVLRVKYGNPLLPKDEEKKIEATMKCERRKKGGKREGNNNKDDDDNDPDGNDGGDDIDVNDGDDDIGDNDDGDGGDDIDVNDGDDDGDGDGGDDIDFNDGDDDIGDNDDGDGDDSDDGGGDDDDAISFE